MKIDDVCEFYSPTGGGVRRYINQKLALAKWKATSEPHRAGALDTAWKQPWRSIAWVKSRICPLTTIPHVLELPAGVADAGPSSRPGGRIIAWQGGWLAARWPGKAVKVFFMHADPWRYPPNLPGWLAGAGSCRPAVRFLLAFSQPAEQQI